METLLLVEEKQERGMIHLDPRTKLLILLFGNIAVILAPSLEYEIALAITIMLFGFLSGVYRYTITIAVIYGALVVIQTVGAVLLPEMLRVIFVSFAMFVRKIFPCAMLGGILVLTTRVNQFMAAMHKLQVPKSIVIPLAVMLRYFPMAKEEWQYIRDAMAIRGVSASFLGFLRHPLKTVEYIYVPMMFSASKIADELSAAAISRGIENPNPRTCIVSIGIAVVDVLCALIFVLLLLAALWV